MTVLTIRSCKRYAVRHSVMVSCADGLPTSGLLIEVSQEGCRISNLGQTPFRTGDRVAVRLDETYLGGHVRWAADGVVGVRFSEALFAGQLNELLTQSRG